MIKLGIKGKVILKNECGACETTGSMTDIIFNSDCPICDSCWCTSCNYFTGGLEENDNCPVSNPCLDCGHTRYPIDCPRWPGDIELSRNNTNKKYKLIKTKLHDTIR